MTGRQGWNLRGPYSKDRCRMANETHCRWKGDNARDQTKRQRARRMFKLDYCEDCGQSAHDRHHKDGNPGNNSIENIAILCRRCHMKRDGRLAALKHSYPCLIPKVCRICGRVYKPLRKGRCGACDVYYRRIGQEWTSAVVSTKPRRGSWSGKLIDNASPIC